MRWFRLTAILVPVALVLLVVTAVPSADQSKSSAPTSIYAEADASKLEKPPVGPLPKPPAPGQIQGAGEARIVGPPPAETVDGPEPGLSDEPPLRDPTQPGDGLREVVAPFRMGQGPRPGGSGDSGLPEIVLKGRIVGPEKPPAAMLEIDEFLHVVHEGSRLSVPSEGLGLGSITVEVKELTATEIRLEISPLRQEIVIR